MLKTSSVYQKFLLGSTILSAVLTISNAHAQQQTTQSSEISAQASDDTLGAQGLGLQEIVVTGTSDKKTRFLAPYAISTINSDAIQEKEPRSMVDLLRSVPGINVENSGGEGGGENIVIRGLPWSGFRLIDVLEDGLPLFESNFERELQIDQLYRVDLNTTRVELVRGGTAPIYSNNASGGVVNFITNHGTTTPERDIKLTTGSYGQARIDGEVSGPVNDNLLYSASGFFRRDDGLRDPGFSNADEGGQFKVGGAYLLENGKIYADFKYLNDRSIFYSDIPLTDPRNGNSLSGLINPTSGTLDSNNFRNVQILALNGSGGVTTLSRDLADGIHPDVKTLTIGGETDLGDGWGISDKARYVDGSVGFNAIFNGAPADAVTNLNGFLSAAQRAFPGTASLRYVYAGTNTPFNPATTAGLTMTNTWETVQTNYTDAFNDLRLTKSIDSVNLGKHDLTFGYSSSAFSMQQQQLGNVILTDVKNNPDALDVQALNASGNVIGAVTQKGFTAYGSGDLIGNLSGWAVAAYAAENWHINDDWQIDVGGRHELQIVQGNRGVIGTQTVSTTGPVAAQSVTGLIGYVPYTKDLHGTSWTVGSSYQINPSLNAFVRYSDTYSLPRLSDQWVNLNNGVAGTLPNGQPVPVTPIEQAEGGLKLSLPNLQLALIGFWSQFKNLNASTYVANAAGVLTNQSLLINTATKGVEFEGAWRPLSFFELNGSVTLEDPVIENAITFNTISAASLSNKVIPRVPKYSLTIEPSYIFQYNGMNGKLFTTIFAEGSRYQDFVNTSILPAYATVDAGIRLQVTESLGLELLGTNLTNSAGLTEGNARAPLSNTLTAADASVGRPIFGRTFTASATYHW